MLSSSSLGVDGWIVKRSGGICAVFGGIASECQLFLFFLREHSCDENAADDDRGDAGEVRPVLAVDKRLLRGGDYLGRVLGVLRRGVGGAAERLGQLVLNAVGHLACVR